MAIKELPNGKYQVTVRDRLSRKEQQHTFQRKGDAEAWEREQKHAMDHGRYMRDSKETLAERSDAWIQRKRAMGGYRHRTLQNWQIHIDHYIKPKLGDLRTQRLTIKNCKEASLKWVSQCSANQANVVLGTLTAILKDAQEEEIVEVNVAERTPRIKIATENYHDGEVQPEDVYNEEDLAALLDATEPGSVDRIVVWLGGFCGMRIGEMLGFSWPAIDLKAKRPKVRVLKNLVAEHKQRSEFPGYKNSGRALRDPKSKKSRGRAIDAPREMVHDLRLWKLKWTPAQPVARSDGKPFDPLASQIVLTTVEGQPYQTKAIQAMLDAAIERAKITRRTVHRLRHTFASQLLATGEPGMLPRVSRLLGHGDVGITARVYTHFIDDETTPAQDLASRVLARAKKKDAVDE